MRIPNEGEALAERFPALRSTYRSAAESHQYLLKHIQEPFGDPNMQTILPI